MLKRTTSVHRRILKKAWEITKQNKFLWLFGFFAALLGNGSIYEVLTKGFFKVTGIGERALIFHNFWLQIFIFWDEIKDQFTQSPFVLGVLSFILIFFLVLLIVLIWAAVVSRGALIASIAKIQKREKINFQKGWTTGKNFFWQILGLNILARGLVFGFLFLIGIPTLLILEERGPMLSNFLLYLSTFIIFIALALIVSMMAIYASAFIVIKKLKFFEAIKAGWDLFIKNWLVSLEMALILFLISIGVGAIVILGAGLVTAPFLLLLLNLYYLNLQLAFWMILPMVLIWLCLFILAGAGLITFQFSSWTLLFIDLNKKRIFSKLMRFVGIER